MGDATAAKLRSRPLRGIFRYPGGKNRPSVQRWIRDHMPPGVAEYREPFVGGGGVFFSVDARLRRWVNDLNAGLVAVYLALRDRPAEFIARCRGVEPARDGDPMTAPGPRGGEPVNARLKGVFDSVALNTECDQAFRYFFVNRTVFGGRVNYDIPSRLYFSNPSGWDIVGTDALERAAETLRGVRVTCGDYAPLLSDPGEGVWVYCDPPYVVNTEMSRTSQLYQHGFTEDDHRRFAAAVKASPHRVAVSYDEDPMVRDLFAGCHFVEGDWAYCGTTNAEKETGKELLILNYKPPGLALSLFIDSEVGDDLTRPEEEEFARLEEIIDRFRRSFVEAGLALRTIRNRRYYREAYDTFEGYCEERWGFAQRHPFRLIEAAEVVEELQTCPMGHVLPASERVVRELVPLDTPEQRAEVWQRVVQRVGNNPGKITAAVVREEVRRVVPVEPVESDPPDWRKALGRAWSRVPESDRGEAREYLLALIGGEDAEEVA